MATHYTHSLRISLRPVPTVSFSFRSRNNCVNVQTTATHYSDTDYILGEIPDDVVEMVREGNDHPATIVLKLESAMEVAGVRGSGPLKALLCHAVKWNNMSLISYVLENRTCEKGCLTEPLVIAVDLGSICSINLLLEHGADPADNVVNWCILKTTNGPEVHTLFDVRTIETTTVLHTTYKITASMLAIERDREDILQLLLNASIYSDNITERLCLHHVLMRGLETGKCCNYLLGLASASSDLNTNDGYEATPFRYAVSQTNLDLDFIQRLVVCGASLKDQHDILNILCEHEVSWSIGFVDLLKKLVLEEKLDTSKNVASALTDKAFTCLSSNIIYDALNVIRHERRGIVHLKSLTLQECPIREALDYICSVSSHSALVSYVCKMDSQVALIISATLLSYSYEDGVILKFIQFVKIHKEVTDIIISHINDADLRCIEISHSTEKFIEVARYAPNRDGLKLKAEYLTVFKDRVLRWNYMMVFTEAFEEFFLSNFEDFVPFLDAYLSVISPGKKEITIKTLLCRTSDHQQRACLQQRLTGMSSLMVLSKRTVIVSLKGLGFSQNLELLPLPQYLKDYIRLDTFI